MRTCNFYRILFISLTFYTLSACSDKQHFVNIEEFEAFISSPDYPYTSTVEKNDITITATYLPTDALLINQYQMLSKVTDSLTRKSYLEDIEKERERMADAYYFKLIITPNDPTKDIIYSRMTSGQVAYSQWLQKLLFSIGGYVKLFTDRELELPLIIYHMDRTFGLQPGRTILLVFDKNPKTVKAEQRKCEVTSLQLKINEFGLKTGPIKFTFKIPFSKYTLDPKSY